ncbi:hypothetical protein STRIP9103_01568 [Streptomyces ipomoeae 91-03]|uniref:Uncharacterized protein n=1 Tax=Streptomyces ipomoeae 91-03 TaxID=698759 RepID=L1KM87_9ACTN|nr:hypothetical protein STRIP9103_01568 [Streptomyces ipomoeae 91-03]
MPFLSLVSLRAVLERSRAWGRVTSLTSTAPRRAAVSTRRPALLATAS